MTILAEKCTNHCPSEIDLKWAEDASRWLDRCLPQAAAQPRPSLTPG